MYCVFNGSSCFCRRSCVLICQIRSEYNFRSCFSMDTGCLSSMNITGTSQARSFAGQLPTHRCFASSSIQALKSSQHVSFGVKSLVLRNKGKRFRRRLGALQVQPLYSIIASHSISCENIFDWLFCRLFARTFQDLH